MASSTGFAWVWGGSGRQPEPWFAAKKAHARRRRPKSLQRFAATAAASGLDDCRGAACARCAPKQITVLRVAECVGVGARRTVRTRRPSSWTATCATCCSSSPRWSGASMARARSAEQMWRGVMASENLRGALRGGQGAAQRFRAPSDVCPLRGAPTGRKNTAIVRQPNQGGRFRNPFTSFITPLRLPRPPRAHLSSAPQSPASSR